MTGPTVSWTIAILGAGFMDETTFKSVSDKFVKAILADSEFGAAAARNQITFTRTPLSPALLVTKKGDRCGFIRDRDLGKGLAKVLPKADLGGLASIIVLNSNASVDACAAGELFLADAGASRAGPHELGHALGGLFDEIKGMESRDAPVVGPNCISPTETPPWDPRLFPKRPQPGCWQDAHLLRPTDNCKMQTGTGHFCPACIHRLTRVFSTPVPSTAGTHTQFVLQVWSPKVFDVISTKTYNRPAPPQVIRGPIVLGLQLDETRICLGGSFQEPLVSRGYRAPIESSWSTLTDANDDSLFVIMNCPGTVGVSQLKSFQEIRIAPTRQIWLTPEIFRNNRIGEPRDFQLRPLPL